MLNNNLLNSLYSTGSRFTWDNKRRAPHQVLERLDRYVANAQWLSTFPHYRSVNLDFFGLDHRPVLLKTLPIKNDMLVHQHKAFSFNHNWLLEEDYKETCANFWRDSSTEGDIPRILSSMANKLGNWAKVNVGSLPKKIKSLSKHINDLWENGMGTKDDKEIGILEAFLEKTQLKEEIYWKQRSHNNWLASGYRNTAFFHNTASAQRKRNWILKLSDGLGAPVSNPKKMEEIVINYYAELFHSQGPSRTEVEEIMGLLSPGLNQSLIYHLSAPFSGEKVCRALFDLNPSKAPGPDGFMTYFF